MANSDETKVICDVCRHDMFDVQKTHVGMNIYIPEDSKEGQRLKEMFGKTDFKVCCACMIKSSGIKMVTETHDVLQAIPTPTVLVAEAKSVDMKERMAKIRRKRRTKEEMLAVKE